MRMDGAAAVHSAGGEEADPSYLPSTEGEAGAVAAAGQGSGAVAGAGSGHW